MSGKIEDLEHRKPRSDEELRTALAEFVVKVGPHLETQAKLRELRDALYKKHITPVEEKLDKVREVIQSLDATKRQIDFELKVNRNARIQAAQLEAQARKRRLAMAERRVFTEGLERRLTTSADALDKQPHELAQSLAGALRKAVEHPNFAEATGKIGVRIRGGASMRIILGEADSEYFLGCNPPAGTQMGETVRQITGEIADVDKRVVRDFIGFRVDAADSHPVTPFALIRQGDKVSRMMLPAVGNYCREPLKAITHIIQNGEISLQTTPLVVK